MTKPNLGRMSLTMKLKETAEDVAVKDRLFDSSLAEVLRFAKKHCELHIVGEGEVDDQKDILCAAKMKGYQMGVVRSFSSLIRRKLIDSSQYTTEVSVYRERLGL